MTSFVMNKHTWYVYRAPCSCGCGRIDTWIGTTPPKEETNGI